MKLLDLYYRVIGTTGLDVMDLNSLKAAVSNCLADLTSRGYKIFKELHLKDFLNYEDVYEFEKILNPDINQIYNSKEFVKDKKYKNGDIVKLDNKYYIYKYVKTNITNADIHNGLLVLAAPSDIRKIVYVKLFFEQDADIATRYSLSNPRVQCKYDKDEKVFRSMLEQSQSIYFVKNDKLYIEWDTNMRNKLLEISFGYYQKLYCPEDFPTDPNDINKMEEVEINIRPEFEDALVLYAAYFYTARYIKDTDKVNLTLSNYKYYVEDIIHELSYEDEFNEEDAVIKLEEE